MRLIVIEEVHIAPVLFGNVWKIKDGSLGHTDSTIERRISCHQLQPLDMGRP
jgi:hypothetical protein